MRTVVIGVGNPVRGDDAVGLHAARAVREALGSGSPVDVREVWAGGLTLAEEMVGFDRAIVVDAMTSGRVANGSVLSLGLEDLGPCRALRCSHDTSLPAALEFWRAAGEHVPADVTVLGVEAVAMDDVRDGLSDGVQAAIPGLVASVLALLAGETGAAS
jgi:hydrogenase maturation protease